MSDKLVAATPKGIRHADVGLPSTVRTYVTLTNCEKAVRNVVVHLRGVCNVVYIQVPPDNLGAPCSDLRWTALLCCFSDETDLGRCARSGFMVFR